MAPPSRSLGVKKKGTAVAKIPSDGSIRKTCRRFNIAGHFHELTFSCYGSQDLLSQGDSCHYLADAIIHAKSRRRFHLRAYVFMPEHVHLLIQPELDEYSISEILQSIKQPVARRTLAYARQNDPAMLACMTTGQKHTLFRFWQAGGGYDRNLFSPSAIHKAIIYIHSNPVRRGWLLCRKIGSGQAHETTRVLEKDRCLSIVYHCRRCDALASHPQAEAWGCHPEVVFEDIPATRRLTILVIELLVIVKPQGAIDN